MTKTICGKVYDTEKATVVEKRTFLEYGDPKGYEITLYRTEQGSYFLYTNGGEESPYKSEGIKRLSAAKAEEWLLAK